MKYKLYTHTLSLCFLLCCISLASFGQVQITTPVAADTVLCNGGPLTLHAVNNGRVPITVNLGATSVDDHYSVTTIPLGFSFNFYGNTYTNCVISSNGLITFNSNDVNQGAPWAISNGIPVNTDCRNAFMGCYSDIYLNYSGQGGSIDYATVGTAPNRQFVVTFCNVPMFSNLSGCPNNPQYIIFQMILDETTNTLESYIKNKTYCTQWNGGLAIEGVENSSGSAGTAAPGRNATQWTANHDGQMFRPNSGFTSYTDTTVPYIHIPATSAPLLWFQGSPPITGPLLATGDSLTVDPTTTTTYTVLAVDCGDTSFASVTVTIGLTPVISGVTYSSPLFCGQNDGSITLHGLIPDSSYTIFYNRNGASQTPVYATAAADGTLTLPGLYDGFYDNIVVVAGIGTSTGACPSQPVGPVMLVYPPFQITNISFTNPSVCGVNDGTITLYGIMPGQSDTVNYNMNGNPQTPYITTAGTDSTIQFTGLSAGTYDNFTVKADTCVSNPAGPVTLLQPIFQIDSISSTNPTCSYSCDGTITMYGLTPLQNITVNYNMNGTAQPQVSGQTSSDSTITITNLCAGTYDNIIATLNTCATNPPPALTLYTPPLVPQFTYAIHYGCNGDTVTFTNTTQSTGPVYYRWDFGDGGIDTATNTSHIYTLQDTFYATLFVGNHICQDSVTDTIVLIHPLQVSFTVTGDTSCQGQVITFNNTSIGTNLSYLWSFGDGTTDNTESPTHTYAYAGTYTTLLTETDFVPCTDTASMQVHIDSASALYMGVSDTTICEGKAITFTGYYSTIGNTGITWTFGDGSNAIFNTNPISHSFDVTGTFTITANATYRVCPEASATANVTVLPPPMINLGPDTAMCPNSAPIVIRDSANYANPLAAWLWSTGDTTSSITVAQPGLYYSTVTVNGCTNADSVLVKNDCYITIPNAFTPNGDGVNDYFFPRQLLSGSVTAFSMNIYNRWGQEIFETTNTEGRGWDGKLNNELQPEGVYIYIIDVAFKDGEKEHHQGNVTLLR